MLSSFDKTCNMKNICIWEQYKRQPVPDPHYIIPIKQYRHYLRTFANINKPVCNSSLALRSQEEVICTLGFTNKMEL